MTAFIHILLFSCGPLTISGLVIAVIIYTFDSQLWFWPWSHIGKEILKGITPAITHGNSTSTVILKGFRLGVVAPADHARPSDVFWRLAFSVLGITCFKFLPVETTTADGVCSFKSRPENQDRITAITTTDPSNVFAFIWSTCHDREPIKLLTGQILKIWHSVKPNITTRSSQLNGQSVERIA